MSVYWLIPAQDQLQDAVAQLDAPTSDFQELLGQLSAALQDTFQAAKAIIVIERINGYSQGTKNHVLRVEYVDETDESHAAIVKLDEPEQLADELAGWKSCGRLSNSRGVVLMPLRQGARNADGRPKTIVYEDAEQRLRAARLISLEDAVLTACRWNDPECRSVEHVLDEVFVELHKHLYQRARAEDNPAALADELQDRLRKGMAAWNSPHSQQEDCRSAVMSVLPGSVVDLLDPLDYLPTLLNGRKHLPEVMRGCAHGDLHGRNVLVGIHEHKALFAAVFDYEDMRSDLLLGWDFAKLETEVKVRAFQHIFSGEEPDFIQRVYEFEERLAEKTLARSKWPTSGDPTKHESPEERLFELLLAVRDRAQESLAAQPRRSHSWLHEYYFLLATYGLYAGKFGKTYGRRQFLSAFISASVASAQHAWAKNAKAGVTEREAARARLAIQEDKPDERLDVVAAESYHVPFAFASEFCRSRERAFVTASTEILKELRDKFPYVLAIWQELALANLELLDMTGDRKYLLEAKRVLKQLDTQYPYRSHYETLCRQGRLWKDCADVSFDDGDDHTAMHDYEESLAAYLKAYHQTNNYYPGINAATLYLLVGQAGASAKFAQAILDDIEAREFVPDDELTWVLATTAEANLLLEHYDDARIFYEQAVARPDCKPHYRSAMLKQVKRILRMKPCRDPNFDIEDLKAVFG